MLTLILTFVFIVERLEARDDAPIGKNTILFSLRSQALRISFIRPKKPGGDSHMKQTGMLVVSLRGVNFGFWSRLGCSGQSANILSRQGLV